MADDRVNENVIEIVGAYGLEGNVAEMDQSMEIGKMPFMTHSSEHLQNAPPDWKEIVAADEERASLVKPRKEFPIPSLESSGCVAETERPYRGRHCKMFYSKWGCPYGDGCPYLHDEEAKGRETNAIILGPGSRFGGRVGGATRNGGPVAPLPLAPPPLAPPTLAPPALNSTLRPSNWRTRICNKWEQDGFCPFGSRCFFAHGAAELQPYGGGLVDKDDNRNKHIVAAPGPSAGASDSEQPPGTERPRGKWKGPDKISRIYGDWIEDLE